MSRALSSGRTPDGAPQLWWLTDDGELASDPIAEDLQAYTTDTPWVGLAAHGTRLLLWTDRALHVANTATGGFRCVISVEAFGIDDAGWARGTPDTAELYWHETTGHPTDRSGFREVIELASAKRTTVAHRQVLVPPWGSRGHVTTHGDICSGPAGVVYEEWRGSRRRFWWRASDRRGRSLLPDELAGCHRYRLLDHDEATYVCGFKGHEVRLADVSGETALQRFEGPGEVTDAAFHDDRLFLALRSRDPAPATVLL